jgi:hypothetical protein
MFGNVREGTHTDDFQKPETSRLHPNVREWIGVLCQAIYKSSKDCVIQSFFVNSSHKQPFIQLLCQSKEKTSSIAALADDTNDSDEQLHPFQTPHAAEPRQTHVAAGRTGILFCACKPPEQLA